MSLAIDTIMASFNFFKKNLSPIISYQFIFLPIYAIFFGSVYWSVGQNSFWPPINSTSPPSFPSLSPPSIALLFFVGILFFIASSVQTGGYPLMVKQATKGKIKLEE